MGLPHHEDTKGRIDVLFPFTARATVPVPAFIRVRLEWLSRFARSWNRSPISPHRSPLSIPRRSRERTLQGYLSQKSRHRSEALVPAPPFEETHRQLPPMVDRRWLFAPILTHLLLIDWVWLKQNSRYLKEQSREAL